MRVNGVSFQLIWLLTVLINSSWHYVCRKRACYLLKYIICLDCSQNCQLILSVNAICSHVYIVSFNLNHTTNWTNPYINTKSHISTVAVYFSACFVLPFPNTNVHHRMSFFQWLLDALVNTNIRYVDIKHTDTDIHDEHVKDIHKSEDGSQC